MNALQTFKRERTRYEHDQRRFYEAKRRKYDRLLVEHYLNVVEDILASDAKLAEQYLAVHEIGRGWGADSKWVGNQIRLHINRERREVARHEGRAEDPNLVKGISPSGSADEARKGASGNDVPSDFDQAAFQQWDAKQNRGGGTRSWVEFERLVLGFIHDAGGANVRPGVQMPKEIVRDAHDKAWAHRDVLEPLVADHPLEAITLADLLIVSYPARLMANVRGTKTGYMDRGTKRVLDAMDYCLGCGLPFMRFTENGNPTVRGETCDKPCWNRKRRAERAALR